MFAPPEFESFYTANSKVYISYDPKNPPAHPGQDWTRFICISDTHSHSFIVPSGDVLLHSGDLSLLGRADEIRVTTDWLRGLDHPIKMSGNHDLPLHKEWYENSYRRFHVRKESPSEIRNIIDNTENRNRGLIYLQDEKYTFCTKEGGRKWSVYGSPWQPYYCGWAFNYLPEEAPGKVPSPLLPLGGTHFELDRVAAIPEVDILLTHGPPHDVLDTTFSKDHVGCPALLAHLSEMKRPPLLHVFGHIHEAHGAVRYSWPHTKADSSSSNAEGTIPPTPGTRETIMVNAANQPLGRQAFADGQRIPCGGPGFQPVIVDLLDSAT